MYRPSSSMQSRVRSFVAVLPREINTRVFYSYTAIVPLGLAIPNSRLHQKTICNFSTTTARATSHHSGTNFLSPGKPWKSFSGQKQSYATSSTSTEGSSSKTTASSTLISSPAKLFFVGGKGGTGKTTTAAALAQQFAKSGKKVLVVSTDPAHSLADCFQKTLTDKPTLVCNENTNESGNSEVPYAKNLYAMEIDPKATLENLKQSLAIDKIRGLIEGGQAGLGSGVLNALNLVYWLLLILFRIISLTRWIVSIKNIRLKNFPGWGRFEDLRRNFG